MKAGTNKKQKDSEHRACHINDPLVSLFRRLRMRRPPSLQGGLFMLLSSAPFDDVRALNDQSSRVTSASRIAVVQLKTAFSRAEKTSLLNEVHLNMCRGSKRLLLDTHMDPHQKKLL
ncbi:hypothetical protein CEXT_348691 [Caerostris extrusa]|uniref:Uncharacterized protein n=1 Tax=Caerostris extrusa TaxID=172846 RepID=A0AAV4XT94_CAEEX|nr:hypothetical protein CEXT_348691 [Caerostris extrusa]